MDVWSAPASLRPNAKVSDNVYGSLHVRSSSDPPALPSLSVAFDTDTDSLAFAYPLSTLASVRLRTPSAARPSGHVVLRTKQGTETCVFFHTETHSDTPPASRWLGRQFIEALAPLQEMVASQQEPGLFLLDPLPKDRAFHTSPRFSDDAIEAVLARRVPLEPQKTRTDTLAQWAKSTRLSVLSQFSQVTRGVRQSRDAFTARAFTRRAQPQVSSSQAGPYMVSPQTHSTLDSSVIEYDAARVYLAKWAQQIAREGELNQLAEHAMDEGPNKDAEELLGATALPPIPGMPQAEGPVNLNECTTMLEAGTSIDIMAQHIFHRGLMPSARRVMWPYLLGAWPRPRNPNQRAQVQEETKARYDALLNRWFGKPDARPDLDGSRHRIWIDCLRADTKHPFFQQSPHGDAYAQMQKSGWDRPAHQGTSETQVNPHLYALSSILLTFVFYTEEAHDPDMPHVEGYVQGMSDLCLVCYVACEGDEVAAFWTFVALMRRWGENYVADQSGMRHELLLLQRLVAELCPQLYAYLRDLDALHLFFCFRWILVCFKREFPLDDVLRLWDALWAAQWTDGSGHGWPLCTHFELFVSLAILESHFPLMMRHLRSFDEVLMFIHSLSHQMDIATVLRRSEALVYRFRSRVVHTENMDPDLRAIVMH
ncbi:GTPase activating protein [Malassezia caprae]|uniref:GTPase activating protein n=1 Tax=Malassezia caprae TaxID=1381934 RepID=A0AAF0EAV8_9BASI|nr:GTPase activating protein [Malassezia caprae]